MYVPEIKQKNVIQGKKDCLKTDILSYSRTYITQTTICHQKIQVLETSIKVIATFYEYLYFLLPINLVRLINMVWVREVWVIEAKRYFQITNFFLL